MPVQNSDGLSELGAAAGALVFGHIGKDDAATEDDFATIGLLEGLTILREGHCMSYFQPNTASFGFVWLIIILFLAKTLLYSIYVAEFNNINPDWASVISRESSWNLPLEPNKRGGQIDLMIDRDDRFICMCEMKFTRGEFEVKKEYGMTLLGRAERVQELVGNKKTVMSVLVTTYGLKRNEYASRFDRVVTLEDLFQK